MAEHEPAGSLVDADRQREVRFGLPFGTLAFVGAFGSLVTCYGIIVAGALFGAEPLGIDPHLQAVLMWGFGLVAIYGLWRDSRQHGSALPLAVGAAGVGVLVLTLYVSYDQSIEALAYVLLVVAALMNQNAMVVTLYRTVRQQAMRIEAFNRDLEGEVRRQVGEIERLARLKEFLAPQVAELVIAEGNEELLKSHRRYIACLFCDIREFTSLSDGVEPEETISLLQAYHERIGSLVAERRGTIGYRAGDGLMVFFNDPIPCERPVLDAVALALDIRAAWRDIGERWRRLGHPIGIGIGIASGYATLGLVGHHGRADYTAIGNVVNVAARLCDQAADGEILMDQRAYLDVEGEIEAVACSPRRLKGVSHPVESYMIRGLREGSSEVPAGTQGAPHR